MHPEKRKLREALLQGSANDPACLPSQYTRSRRSNMKEIWGIPYGMRMRT